MGIEELKFQEKYKYLGIRQNTTIDHSHPKNVFTEQYKNRVTKILNTKLAGRNITIAINTWAVPILTYSFRIIKWSDTDLDNLDRTTRRLLTKFRCLHPNSSVTRLYLPRKEGGRGLINIYNLCRAQEHKIRNNLQSSEDNLIKTVI